MTALNIPLFAFFTVLTVLVLAAGLRRLMGLRLSPLPALVPMLRRLPRRIDRIGGALEDGRLTLSVRLLADPSDRRYVTAAILAVRVLVQVFRPSPR